jgi:hypothetical protein
MKGLLMFKAKGLNTFAVTEMELAKFVAEYTITGNMVVGGFCILSAQAPPGEGPICFICADSQPEEKLAASVKSILEDIQTFLKR